MTINAYPLTWPQQFPRAKYREAGRFKTSITAALKNVQDSLRLFASDSGKKLENLVISSNVTLGAQKPADPGVAVWFTWDGLGICIAVDRYTSVESNLQAIHHIIEARRVELRHGTLALVRATFTGFKALPAPPGKQWFEILGVTPQASRDEINAAYRKLASENHPDKGGSAEAMAAVNKARDEGLRAAA
ncbi:J domain-containing protein [Hydrogenophaga pseudoflava]|uniref:J domain-containing protein n=1 Tax=Hydrogenophaga pseudoflava TaxID=47421 RepID=UPI0027E44185|nr:J domain-containing protein [Hydrogenophaga pseudoflava]MDQ7745405.1 J domain-containing protein [Hydrogenophaga pseudoflava]